jgi:hypothetical protein
VGNLPIILESNQNHARAEDTEVCPCLPASMGLGGGYVPMIVNSFSIQRTDEYKLSEKSSTLSARDYKSATDLMIGKEGDDMESVVRRLTPLE